MANVRTFTIQINGVQESINAVDSLNEQLKQLEAKINSLQGMKIDIAVSMPDIQSVTPNVQTTNSRDTDSSRSSRVNELSDEDRLLKQIESTQSRINQADMADYKVLLNKKQELKELVTEQKSMTAEARLTENAYSNTMLGMKQQLADIKAAMQTVDLNDTDTLNKLANDANELNTKLKEIEASYGQFGRNVGNYANGVAEGLAKASESSTAVKVVINGVTREFDDARQASRELGNELKSMAVNGKQDTQEFKELQKAVAQLNSDMKDATVSSQAMDNLLDAMEGIAALGSVTKGFSALFGFDDSKIEESIQKLVALQNILQGVEKIRQQMNTGEGIGGVIAKGNAAIDALITKMLGVKVATEGATMATKALGLALKGLGIGLVIAAVMKLVEVFDKLEKEEEKAEEEAEKLRKQIDEQRQTYVNSSTQFANMASRISHLREEYAKTNDELKKKTILKEASAEFKKLGISINGVTDAQKVLVKQGDDVIQLIKLQGNAAALAALRMEAFKKSFNMLLENGYDPSGAASLASYNKTVLELDKSLDKVNEEMSKLQGKLKISGESFEKNKKEVIDYEKSLEDLRLKGMKDGLNKRLMQLDEEKRQTLNKFKDNQKAYLEAEKLFEEARLNIVKDYSEKLSKEIETSTKSIGSEKFKNAIDKLSIDKERQLTNQPKNVGLLTEKEIQEADNGLKTVAVYYTVLEEAYEKQLITKEELFKEYDENIKNLTEEQQAELVEIYESTDGDIIKKKEEYYRVASEMLKSESALYKNYGLTDEETLSSTIESRLTALRSYHDTVLKEVKKNLEERVRIEEINYVKLKVQAEEDEKNRWENQEKELKEAIDSISKLYFEQEKIFKEKQGQLSEDEMKTYKEVEEKRLESLENMLLATTNHKQKMKNIEEEYNNNILKLENDTAAEKNRIQTSYFDTQISNFREFTSKINNEVAKQPVYDKFGFGIINLSATKKNYKELLDATTITVNEIKQEKENLSEAFRKGFLSPESYNAILTQLNDIDVSVNGQMESIEKNIDDLGSELWKSINNWIQQVGQAVTSIMSSISEMTSNQYEKQIDQQEKYIDELQKLYDKQEQIAEEHASAINDIENELSTARGDRRQQLIDALNAEMAARRAALAEQKKVEKEQEKAERKKAELEYDQAVAKKKMDLAQAAINASMAVSMAAVNKWPIPAIPMMALAAAVGAAQIAAVSSQYIPKPSYGDGGVIVGKSHREGGVPVLGGQAEVEGGEFITNKVTTAKNVDLLEFINKKRKRIDISDLLEFYNSDKPSKGVASIKTKFVDGGVIPQLRSDISFNDRLITAFEDYSNRPQYVQVVDIIDQTERLNEVKVISGLEV